MLRLEDLKEYQRTRSVPAPVADPPAEGGAGPQDPLIAAQFGKNTATSRE